MRLRGNSFVADWVDAKGKRHRKTFASATDAQAHEHEMIVKAKAAEIGAHIAAIAKKQKPDHNKVIRRLLEECTLIATNIANRKPVTTSRTQERCA